MKAKFVSFLSLFLFLMVSACNKGDDAVVKPLPDSTVIVEFKGGKVTAKDVKDQLESQLNDFNDQAIEAYKRAAQNAAVTKILEAKAKEAGVAGPRELIEQQVANAGNVTDADVDAFMKQNKDEISKGYVDPQTGKKRTVSKDEIKSFLESQNKNQASQNFIRSLVSEANMKVVLKEKTTEVPLNPKAPMIGSKDAKVVIHEWSDFQCPFCSRAKDVVNQIKQFYGDKVALYFRHFPLTQGHPEAVPSAVASECAKEQGKFWEYHDALFDRQKDLPSKPYNDIAKSLELDMEKFETCMANSELEAYVMSDFEAGEKVGVNSTPTFFINGKKVAGALPFDQFKQMIDEELNK